MGGGGGVISDPKSKFYKEQLHLDGIDILKV